MLYTCAVLGFTIPRAACWGCVFVLLVLQMILLLHNEIIYVKCVVYYHAPSSVGWTAAVDLLVVQSVIMIKLQILCIEILELRKEPLFVSANFSVIIFILFNF